MSSPAVATVDPANTQVMPGTDPAAPFDIAVELEPGSDPAPFAAAGATWGLVAFPWDPVSVDQVRGVIRDGPATMS